jgi:hypothetical protein
MTARMKSSFLPYLLTWIQSAISRLALPDSWGIPAGLLDVLVGILCVLTIDFSSAATK